MKNNLEIVDIVEDDHGLPRLLPDESGWRFGNDRHAKSMDAIKCLTDQVFAQSEGEPKWVNLFIRTHMSPTEVVDLGAVASKKIADLFSNLLPNYRAAVGGCS